MPEVFDISQAPPPSSGGPGGGGGSKSDAQRTAEEVSRNVLRVCLGVMMVVFAYLIWGLFFSGVWTNPTFSSAIMDAPGNALRIKQENNIYLAFEVLRAASIIAILCICVSSWDDQSIGYILCTTAFVVYFGLPWLADTIYGMINQRSSEATKLALTNVQALWAIFAVPGVVFVLIDMVRRIQAASEQAVIQRANIKYGQSVGKQKQGKQTQRFLGRCWELPYCREQVRVKCPIYIRRRGPCWWYKEGCMCEERIVLQSVIDSDWKDQVKSVAGSPAAPGKGVQFGVTAPVKANLTPEAKKERCRACIIYNEHQRQKYKVYCAITVVGVPVLFYLNVGLIQGLIDRILNIILTTTANLSISTTSDATSKLPADTSIISGVLIFCLGLVTLSLALKFVEYLSFKLKI